MRVDTTETGVLEFDLDDKEKTALYEKGFAAGCDFLTTWNWQEYITRVR